MPTVCEHHKYQYSCAHTHTHTCRAQCSIHCGLHHRPSEVWSVCRVQRRSLLTIVLALASAGQLGSASSHTIYRSVSEKEVNQRRELETVQSCELDCKRGGEPLVDAWCVHVDFSSGFLSQCDAFSEKCESGVESFRCFLRFNSRAPGKCLMVSRCALRELIILFCIILFPSSSLQFTDLIACPCFSRLPVAVPARCCVCGLVKAFPVDSQSSSAWQEVTRGTSVHPWCSGLFSHLLADRTQN